MFYTYISSKILQETLSIMDVIKYHIRVYNSMMNRKEFFSYKKEKTDFSIPCIDLYDSNGEFPQNIFKVDLSSF